MGRWESLKGVFTGRTYNQDAGMNLAKSLTRRSEVRKLIEQNKGAVWKGDGNNADGLVATPDGGVLFAQNDNNRLGKIDSKGAVTFPYTDLNVSGSMAMNAKGFQGVG